MTLCLLLVNGNEETHTSQSFFINVCVFVIYTLCIAIFFGGGSNNRK